jgi:hypothetical protein
VRIDRIARGTASQNDPTVTRYVGLARWRRNGIFASAAECSVRKRQDDTSAETERGPSRSAGTIGEPLDAVGTRRLSLGLIR